MDETQIVMEWFEQHGPAAEWAAAVTHEGGVEQLKRHVARWVEGAGLYSALLRSALERVDYEAVAMGLIAAWPEGEEE